MYDLSRKHKQGELIGLAYLVKILLISSEALSTSLQFRLMKDLQRFLPSRSEGDPQIADESLILFIWHDPIIYRLKIACRGFVAYLESFSR